MWAVAVWATPACIAGALGWNGIWGYTSAFGDYLVPLPIAGGALHVPSFVLALGAVWAWPRLSPGLAGILRGACAGMALVGAALLVDPERVYPVLTTDLEPHGRGSRNPLGLFILTDALWTLAWMLSQPALAVRLAPALPVALLLPAGYVAASLSTSALLHEPFRWGYPGHASARGDVVKWVYTRLSGDDPAFRNQARAFVAPSAPTINDKAEAAAFLFTNSLAVARRDESEGAPFPIGAP